MFSWCNNVAVAPTDQPLGEVAGLRTNNDSNPQYKQSRKKKVLIVLAIIAVTVIPALSIYIAVSRCKRPTPTPTTAVSDTLSGDGKLDGLEFTDAYNDSTSFEYKQMKEEFCTKISLVLQGGILNHWYRTCEVVGFSPGSVIVHYNLTVVRPTIHQVWHTLEYLMVSALVEDLERPNSTLGAFTSTYNTSLSFGPLRNVTESATPRPTSTTPRALTTLETSIRTTPITTTDRSNISETTAGEHSSYGTTTVTSGTPISETSTLDTSGTTTTGRVTPETDTTFTSGTTSEPSAYGTTTVTSGTPIFETSTLDTSGTTTTGRVAPETDTTFTLGTTSAGMTSSRATTVGTTSIVVTPHTTDVSTTGVDACASQPCQNGGTCTQDDDGYKCTCPVCGCSQGGNTPTCGLAADMCQNQPQFIPHPYNCHKFVQCANSAVANVLPCQPAENVFDPTSVAANCAPLADIACAEPVTKEVTTIAVVTTADTRTCSSVTCLNGGTCEDTSPGVRCLCPSTHTGSTCETEIVRCAETTCQHGANCSDDSSGFHCDCPAGYSGLHCETEIDECASSPCRHASTCVDHVNRYTCLCGYHCGCANQAAGPNYLVTCTGATHGDYIPDPDNCALSYRCLLGADGMARTPSGIANCASGQVFAVPVVACLAVDQAACADYTYYHPQL